MSADCSVVCAASRGIVADDRLVPSSSQGQGSMSCVAEGRVFALNVIYATRSLFPLNATTHVSGLCTSPPSKAKRTSLRTECPTMHVHNQYQGARCEHAHRSLIVLQRRRRRLSSSVVLLYHRVIPVAVSIHLFEDLTTTKAFRYRALPLAGATPYVS